jgi:hypothetical protein
MAMNRRTGRDEINERKWAEDSRDKYQKRHLLYRPE